MEQLMRTLSIFGLIVMMSACTGPKGDTTAEKKAFIDNMASETLTDLYREEPEAKSRMTKMAGYAVFSNINTNLFLFSSGSGYGVAHSGGKKTYMKMYSLGLGPGLGLKDFRAVFMFRDQDTLNKFIEEGWEFGGHADAAAKSDEKGGAVGGQASVDSDIVIYTLTEAGVALQATVAGTKYWKNDELNQ
jgi:lipid-binding SYLF domain-containing protein